MFNNLGNNMDSKRIPKVLIVDDNSTNIKVVASLLAGEYYNISFAKNGKQALEQLKHNLFDIILLDIMMPEMDGFQVCKELKSNDFTKDIPVLFLSARNDIESIVKGFEYGAVDYVVKPFNGQELLARVKTHLELKFSKEKIVSMQIALDKHNNQLESLLNERTEQLIRSEREAVIGQMLQGIVHNMRTPLTILFSVGDIFDMYNSQIKNLSCKDEMNEQLYNILNNDLPNVFKRVVEASKKLNDMVNNLLVKSKLDKRDQLEIIDLNEIIRRELDFLQSDLFFKHRVTKKINLLEQPLPVKIVPSDISQVLGNLIKNSAEAMFEQNDPELEISSGKNKNSCWFSIKDNGFGISDENLKKVFDPFFSTKPQKKEKDYDGPIGTGLGLHFCKKTIESFDGTISIETKLGYGTKFTVTIPDFNSYSVNN